MTRLITAPFEGRHFVLDLATDPNSGGETVTYDTSIKRSGLSSLKITGTGVSGAKTNHFTFTGVVGRTYYMRQWIYVTTFNSSGEMLVSAAGGPLDFLSVWFNTSNQLYLYDDANNVAIGSPSATLSANQWHKIELGFKISASTNDDYGELKVNGTTVHSSTTLNLGTGAPEYIELGMYLPVTDTATIYIDDVALNDDQGSVNNTWCGEGKIVQLLPISDSANGGWSKPGGGTTNLFSSVDNTPPTGIADTTSGTNAERQIRNPNNTASQDYDANMTSYTTAGIVAADTIVCVQWIMAIGTGSTTSTNNGVARLVSNPDQGSDQTINFEGTGATAGTFPTGWMIEKNTHIEYPTVTKGTSPVLRVRKTTTATRVHLCTSMAINVEYIVGVTPIPQKIKLASQAVNRAASW